MPLAYLDKKKIKLTMFVSDTVTILGDDSSTVTGSIVLNVGSSPRRVGFDDGLDDGCLDGCDDGLDDGRDDGWDDGFDDG